MREKIRPCVDDAGRYGKILRKPQKVGEKTVPGVLSRAVSFLEDLSLDGRSTGDIAADLPEEEYRREFFAEPAFLQGKNQKRLEMLSSIKKAGNLRKAS